MQHPNIESPFFRFWFTGWQHGLEELDKANRGVLLKQCAQACAHSYTVKLFQDAWASSYDLNSFVACLQRQIPNANYELKNKNEIIRVIYEKCGCDLVTMGLVSSPLLCECSAYNLQENLEQCLRQKVSVRIISSILRGDPQCVLLAKLDSSSP